MSDVFVALADPARRQILEALAEEPGQSVGDLVKLTRLGQPTVSKHLKTLRDAGLVNVKVSGANRFYSVDTEPLTKVALWVRSVGANDTADTELAALGEKLGELLSQGAAWVGDQIVTKTNIETDPKKIGREMGRRLYDAKVKAESTGKGVADKVVTKARSAVKRKPKA